MAKRPLFPAAPEASRNLAADEQDTLWRHESVGDDRAKRGGIRVLLRQFSGNALERGLVRASLLLGAPFKTALAGASEREPNEGRDCGGYRGGGSRGCCLHDHGGDQASHKPDYGNRHDDILGLLGPPPTGELDQFNLLRHGTARDVIRQIVEPVIGRVAWQDVVAEPAGRRRLQMVERAEPDGYGV